MKYVHFLVVDTINDKKRAYVVSFKGSENLTIMLPQKNCEVQEYPSRKSAEREAKKLNEEFHQERPKTGDSDKIIGRFLLDCLAYVGDDEPRAVPPIYERYIAWCQEHGYSPETRQAWKTMMIAYNIKFAPRERKVRPLHGEWETVTDAWGREVRAPGWVWKEYSNKENATSCLYGWRLKTASDIAKESAEAAKVDPEEDPEVATPEEMDAREDSVDATEAKQDDEPVANQSETIVQEASKTENNWDFREENEDLPEKVLESSDDTVGTNGISYVGEIYILVNPCLPNMVKIGYSNNVEKRLKTLNNNSGLPDQFHVYAIYKVKNRLEDLNFHKLIDSLNPSLRHAKNKEFYDMSPEKVYGILAIIAGMNGSTDLLKKNPLDDEYFDDIEDVSLMPPENQSLLAVNLLEIPDGPSQVQKDETNVVFKTIDDIRGVECQGDTHTISEVFRYIKNGEPDRMVNTCSATGRN